MNSNSTKNRTARILTIFASWLWPLAEAVSGTYKIEQYGDPRAYWLCTAIASWQIVGLLCVENQKYKRIGLVLIVPSTMCAFLLPILRAFVTFSYCVL